MVPKDYRIALTIRGKDYVYPGDSFMDTPIGKWTGCAVFRHTDPRDRPADIFGGDVTLHTGPNRKAYVMLPVIPDAKK